MKGFIIDCDYIRNVKDYMDDICCNCPYHRLRETDGTPIPLVSVEVKD